jgi:hypothetical protein
MVIMINSPIVSQRLYHANMSSIFKIPGIQLPEFGFVRLQQIGPTAFFYRYKWHSSGHLKNDLINIKRALGALYVFTTKALRESVLT